MSIESSDVTRLWHSVATAGLGYQKSNEKQDDGSTIVVLVIKPFWDIVIPEEVEIVFELSKNFEFLGGLDIRLASMKHAHFFGGHVNSKGVFSFSWERSKYMVTVWFYAVRNLLKMRLPMSWSSAPQLDAEFRKVNAIWPPYLTDYVGSENGGSGWSSNNNNPTLIVHASGRTRGKRNYMEDVDFAVTSIKVGEPSSKNGHMGRKISIYGVLDGHGGKGCAEFASEDIPARISSLLRVGKSCPDALFQAFQDADCDYMAQSNGERSGSTAHVMVYDQLCNVLYSGNTGDTRAVLCRNGGTAYELSYDRKATDPEEVARVGAAGGFVANGRVMGSLAVSRALGDMALKPQGGNAKPGVLIPDPELSCFYPVQSDEFVIIATDGLWDVMSSQAAVDFVREKLDSEGFIGIKDVSTIDTGAIQERVGQIANYMALHASSVLNSMDNITVMILLLYGGPTQLPAAATEGTLTSLYDLSQSHRTSIGSSFTKNNKIASTHNGGDKISQQPAVPGSSTNPAPVTLAGNPTNAPTAAFGRVGGRVQQQQQSPQSKLLANSFTQDEIDVLKSLSSAADEGQGDRKRTDQTDSNPNVNTVIFTRGAAVPVSRSGSIDPEQGSTGGILVDSSNISHGRKSGHQSGVGKTATSVTPAGASTQRDDAVDDDLMEFLQDDSNF